MMNGIPEELNTFLARFLMAIFGMLGIMMFCVFMIGLRLLWQWWKSI